MSTGLFLLLALMRIVLWIVCSSCTHLLPYDKILFLYLGLFTTICRILSSHLYFWNDFVIFSLSLSNQVFIIIVISHYLNQDLEHFIPRIPLLSLCIFPLPPPQSVNDLLSKIKFLPFLDCLKVIKDVYIYLKHLFIDLFWGLGIALLYTWRSGNSCGHQISLYHIESGDQAQAISLSGKSFYPLNSPPDPCRCILSMHV